MLIGIFFTPFHFKQYSKVVKTNDENEILFVSDCILGDFLKYLDKKKKIVVFKEFEFRKKDLLRNPFIKVFEYRNAIKYYKKFINKWIDFIKKSVKQNELISLYIFSEKSIFVQMFMSKIKKIKRCKIVAIDEGLGFYCKSNFFDYILKILYPVFNYLIIGFPYRYYKVLGTSSLIDEVYVRFPEFIHGKRKCKIYKIENSNMQKKIIPDKNNNLLLLTSPLSEDRIKASNKEKKLLEGIVSSIIEIGYEVTIKPHPRENLSKYYFIKEKYKDKVKLLTGVLSEEINYFDYRYIINFASSAILDIFSSNYPLKNVITIDIFKVSKDIQIYNLTKVINYKRIKKIIEELKNVLIWR